ncbi:hypothetical protein, partial [Andreprevotia sp. IGB-42]|uniref:hypothetical protein n=1 Tax=Andreprevotia sp. IGB-42 TaxID=2497473 RepID=UPI00135CC48C
MNKVGPTYRNGEFTILSALHRTDAHEGDFGETALHMGHAAHLDPDSQVYDFAIYDRDGQRVAALTAQVDPFGSISAIHDIEVREHARSAGVGRRIVESIVANQPDTVQIIDMIPQSREFWRKLEIENETSRSDDFIQNRQLSWDSLRRADRQGTPAPAARESDTDSRRAESAGILGETPRGEGATEEQLSDEEFARLFPDRPKYSRLGQRTEGMQAQRLSEQQPRTKEVQDQLGGLGDRLSDDA